jgi:hypothetical protein
MPADECLEKGDFDGKVAWLSVIKVIEELQDVSLPEGGKSVH